MFLFDRARGQVRWDRVVPLIALSLMLGLCISLGSNALGVLPRWAVVPLGNGLGLVLVGLWLPRAVRPDRPLPLGRRFLVGVGTAIVFIWAMVAASWSDPFWLR